MGFLFHLTFLFLLSVSESQDNCVCHTDAWCSLRPNWPFSPPFMPNCIYLTPACNRCDSVFTINIRNPAGLELVNLMLHFSATGTNWAKAPLQHSEVLRCYIPGWNLPVSVRFTKIPPKGSIYPLPLIGGGETRCIFVPDLEEFSDNVLHGDPGPPLHWILILELGKPSSQWISDVAIHQTCTVVHGITVYIWQQFNSANEDGLQPNLGSYTRL